MRNAMIFAGLIAALTATALPAQAFGPVTALSLQSGSQSGSRGGGGVTSTNIPDLPERDPKVEAHNRGKRLVSSKISCKKCAHPNGVKDAKTAREVATKVRAGEFDLNKDQRQLVLFYLNNRFGV